MLRIERQADRLSYATLTEKSSTSERRQNGICWYPIAIKGTEIGQGDYLTVEIERTSYLELVHQFRFGMPVAIFSNHNAKTDRIEGVITYISGNTIKISLQLDELPDWASDGKLGIDLLFDDNSYEEMNSALKQAAVMAEKKGNGILVKLLTGEAYPTFEESAWLPDLPQLNPSQQAAIRKIIAANELAIVHGPPGTGKTTTLVQAIKVLLQQDPRQILVVAPSNTAVDLLSEKLSDEGIQVLRVGNPARVSEGLMRLTLDCKMAAHPRIKDIRNLKKQANEYRNLAQKYKRNFGKAEREQRKALFDEARKIMKEVISIEQYIMDDLIGKAQVITATLVGANHYTVKSLQYHTVFIDEAGQSLEPACWIPIIKGRKLILAGDHNQLSPTIKSMDAARAGLGKTLLEKCVEKYPGAVSLLENQYRMNELIMGYSSKVFYYNKLKADASVAHHLLYPGDFPLAFIDTAGCGFEEKLEGTSTTNPEEADFLFRHLSILVSALRENLCIEDFPSIGIISPYKLQIELLKEQLLAFPEWQDIAHKITVNTIDSFQGQERDIIYISLTRSNSNGEIGFLSDTRRMNVAMTRARKKLVVIGDSATLSKNEFYGRFVEYAQNNAAYLSAWEFVNE
ncbi:AAA domain-containing protein [Flavihumibacter fluvii]|uniref:AAA domain-containing protein n=1 Tax=Flavihumibacter fluvii TaxID=2838157 RepID=UPI001EFA9BA4|nr:AAA domain-containing protein [Flavihumibacter fluvii]ULQ53430.1 AAA domain-containing protein [Flavihumibacter fluvii]